MQKNGTIYNELTELGSSLADFPCINVFTVPEGYFTSVFTSILAAVNNEINFDDLSIPDLKSGLPQGYFEGLPTAIINKIKADEEQSAILSSIGKKNVFNLPHGYFEELASGIIKKLSNSQATVVTMKVRRSFFKYAAAAAITALVGLSLFSVFDNKTEQPAIPVVMAQTTPVLNNVSFEKMMESLADEDILRYLKNNGEDVNAALVASITDDKILPAEEAYFTDENVLDKLLTELNIGTNSNN